MENQPNSKDTRLARFFNPKSGKALIIALDHGLVGNLPGIENLPETLNKVIKGEPDAVVVSAGAMSKVAPIIRNQVGVILTIDTFLDSSIPRSTSMGEEHRLLASVEDALHLGADAVKMFLVGGMVNLGAFADNVSRVAEMAHMCDRLGLPLIVEPTLWGGKVSKDQKNDPDLVRHMCRIAFEIGADILKIPNPGSDGIRKITSDIPCPIFIMGGSRVNSVSEMMLGVTEIIDAGADGIVYGQNAWQRENPAEIIRELSQIIHSNKRIDK